MLFVNGLPPGVIELKNPADAEADVWAAWNQLQTYKEELPSLFAMNAFDGFGRPASAAGHAYSGDAAGYGTPTV